MYKISLKTYFFRQLFFIIGFVLSLFFAASYFYFTVVTMMMAAQQEGVSREINSLTGQLAILEERYLTRKSMITSALAAQLGFREAVDTRYIFRDEGFLSLKIED
jgi:ABC-type lipoprotein release transport system permease subunit